MYSNVNGDVTDFEERKKGMLKKWAQNFHKFVLKTLV